MFQPTTFGNYFLTRRLAVGGMAEVFAAKLYGADGFEKDIVIKQILPQYARDPEFVQSFVAEAKIAVTLNHANIVGIYELGRVDGTYFIAMELVDGLDVFTINDVSRRIGEPLDPGYAAYIVEETAKGLDYAHRKNGPDGKPLGLVHRDLSPRNVLVSREGDVKILDFGIAKTQSDAAAMPKTRAGVVKGTSGYMSPEQATGGEVDSRTDVYQAGLLLFELLTGEALFWRPDDEETRDLMRRHRIIRPSEVVPGVHEDLDRICLAALARDPTKRIQTAADLGAHLARYRLIHHPDVGARALGELVSKLSAREAQAEEVAAAALPSTRELKEALTKARAPDAPRIETIATRAPRTEDTKPSNPDALPMTPAQSAPPQNGAGIHTAPRERAPSNGVRTGAPVPTPPPAEPAPVHVPVVQSVPQVVLQTPASEHAPIVTAIQPPRKPSVATAFVVAALAGTLFGIGYITTRDDVEPAPVKPIVLSVPNDPPPRPTTTATATQPQQPIANRDPIPDPVRDPPAKHPTKAPAKTIPAITPTPGAPATVSFGTRSCSSRVSVDGVIVARSTPSYDHKLTAGTHTITIEGTSCRPIERPGSLKSALPSVTKQLKIEAGASMKIIADFEHETLLVRD